jgi:hypothetical protein
MQKIISSSIYEMMVPLVKERLRRSLREAFEIAVFLEDPNLMDTIYDELTEEFLERFKDIVAFKKGHSQQSTGDVPEEFEYEDLSEAPEVSQNIVLGGVRKKPRSKSTTRKKSTQYRGISLDKDGYFRARLTFKGQKKELGRFKNPIEAAKAYDRAAYRIRRTIKGLNFPEDYDR